MNVLLLVKLLGVGDTNSMEIRIRTRFGKMEQLENDFELKIKTNRVCIFFLGAHKSDTLSSSSKHSTCNAFYSIYIWLKIAISMTTYMNNMCSKN